MPSFYSAAGRLLPCCTGGFAAQFPALAETEVSDGLGVGSLEENMGRLQAGISAIGRLLRDTPGAVRARIRIHGVKGTVKALPEMARFAMNNYIQPVRAGGANQPISTEQALEPYDAWLLVNQWTPGRARDLRRRLKRAEGSLPLISVIMPVYNTPEKWLNRAIESLREQVYEKWELCIADDCSPSPHVREVLERWKEADSRIKVVYRGENGHISRATNSAAELATGRFLAFLDHDDELSPDALGEVALQLAEDEQIDLLYSDDDKINENGRRYAPQFKSEYSPELLLSYMYFCHLLVVRKSLFNQLGGIRPGFEGAQDFDFALRAVERARKVVHLPMVLYHWRAISGSTALDAAEKPESFEAGRRAVEEALQRRGIPARAFQPKWASDARLGLFDCEFPDDGPSVSIIIPTKNRLDLLRRCVESIQKITTYKNYQIVIADNGSDDPQTLEYLGNVDARVLQIPSPDGRFSFAYLNNRAVEQCDTEYVLLLNNDTEVIEPKWLSQMMGYARLDGVGSVGARLLYPDDRVQHAGIVHGLHGGLAGHAFKLMPRNHPGYLNLSLVTRNVAAVTAACLLTPRELYLKMNGLDEQHFNVAYNDVDYGYRLLQAGYRNVYCASAVLRHHEGASRGFRDNPREVAAFRRMYGSFKDPYYNPNLSLRNERFEVVPRRLPRGERKLRRVMYVTHAMTHTGAPLIQYEIALQLRNRYGIEPVVFCPEAGPLVNYYREHGIEPIIGPLFFQNVHTGRATYQQMIEQVAQIFRDAEVDAVYANTMLTFWANVAAERAGLASIWNIHESEGINHYVGTMGAALAREAAASFALPYRVVFGSRATMRLYEKLETRHNFTYQHNSVDTQRIAEWQGSWTREEARKALKVAPGEMMLLIVGTVCARKGQLDLVQAYERLPYVLQKQVRCFLVGDVPNEYSQRVADTIARWPDYMKERFTVVRETGQVGRYYRAADVFVCTSRVECFPRVNLEAMYMGLPLVTTPVFGVPEQVWEDVNGLYYRPGDIGQLTAQLQRIITDIPLRMKLAANSVRVAKVLPADMEVAEAYAKMLHEAYLSKM